MRLPNFDYTRPFYYLVTLKAVKGLAPFCRIVAPGVTTSSPITKAFHLVVGAFVAKWNCVEKIEPFVIMPDHVHFIIKLQKAEKPISLPRLVWLLARDFSRAYWECGAAERPAARHGISAAAERGTQDAGHEGDKVPRLASARSAAPKYPPIFERTWHDWIVKSAGQLETFSRYVRENPSRAFLRQQNAAFFQKAQPIQFLNREWFCYGNAGLLDLPILEAFQCSRKWVEGGKEWCVALDRASRLGPGTAGISTFMSPCEKACAEAIRASGGNLIILMPEGFSSRWHPGREMEMECAAGKVLFLSLYQARAAQPDKAELYHRCHEMGNIVMAELGK
jgi:REP element-mobilizing transposase RayT